MLKLVVFLALVVGALAVRTSQDRAFHDIQNTNIINKVNAAKTTWVAGENERFQNASYADVKKLMGTKIIKAHLNLPPTPLNFAMPAELPTSFDARVQWPKYIHPIRDQQQCGSCWAFGAAESFTDRLTIHSQGKIDIVLSPEDLVSCAPFPDQGCGGGIPYFAWHHLKYVGIVSDACFPYTAGNGTAPACAKSCADGSAFVRHKVSSFGKVGGMFTGDVTEIMTEIMTNGPVEGAFTVYQDFMNYKSGVYQHVSGDELGGHAIKILGWGTESGVDYWLVANSWNTSWGDQGYFKIKKGSNECGIEGTVYAGIPAE